jgi:(R)-2-hydroxyacyl-CoA dehydratese activating ATPase
MSAYFMGVDLGSTTAKAVIVDEQGSILSSSVVQMGAVSRQGMQRAVDAVLNAVGIDESVLAGTIGTGYGRRLVPGVQRTFTEVTCHARGTAAMCPGVRLVIDVGGQDSKAITVDETGLVDNFAMNDRCASGTGRAYEVLARAIECSIEELPQVALAGARGQDETSTDDDQWADATSALEVSSMCATFAETEIISLLAQDVPRKDVAAAVHRAVAARMLALVAQVGRRTPVVMTGGVAKNAAAVHFLSEALGQEVQVAEHPQITGAYGAALLAMESAAGSGPKATPVPQEGDADSDVQLFPHQDSGTGHSCVDCDGKAGTVHLGSAIGLHRS